MNQDRPSAISKILSRNDTGETGGHMAGILIPKEPSILAFFPLLSPSILNPRHHLSFADDFGGIWQFAFIYYNNTLFGGTRNEYRLTRMTAFLAGHSLHAGDIVTLRRSVQADYSITYTRPNQVKRRQDEKLKLGSSWKIVAI